jgi:hypothetical protein
VHNKRRVERSPRLERRWWKGRITNLSWFAWALYRFSILGPPQFRLNWDDWPPYLSFGIQWAQFIQETRSWPGRVKSIMKDMFHLDTSAFGMLSFLNESSLYPQTENIRGHKIIGKDCGWKK